MNNTLPLLKGIITLGEALGEDQDVIHQLSYPEKRAIFYVYLDRRRALIADIVSRHLSIPLGTFHLGEVKEWIHGSFNACIPIHINTPTPRPDLPERAIIRFPLPYKTGEEHFPGNVDEKLRCEAATYVWLQQNCPDVPIPRLFGFGFPGTPSLTALENEPFWNRIRWFFRNAIARLAGKRLPRYFAHPRHNLLEVGYLVIEHVAEGRMLSESWKEHHGDQNRRSNLFRGLSRIMLSLAKIPLPRIGSWTMDNQGILSLTNRPLTFHLHQLENQHIPTGIPRDLTYASADTYLSDILTYHDQRMRHQPNSIHSQRDGEDQLAALATMRLLLPEFTHRRFREGPFVMALTDLHQSNIFVDEDWHITRLIDLEWACVRPIEMVLNPPYWLSSQSAGPSALGVDQLIGEERGKYAERHREFASAFEREEEAAAAALHGQSKSKNELTRILRDSWERGTFWYMQALDCPSALYALFMFHIQPRFAQLDNAALDEFSRFVMPYWGRDTQRFIVDKVRQQGEYEEKLRGLFARN
ncbi:hypothetical protein C8A00DRAFT_43010 [Chaetomidium leptoderma]|uniref:Aminoglycoside phosphotransferase domain-containing protein n=1 Tax=Chaetomidium leptoderma TaxID=669021 RepID=A0AAN6VMW6_9PEZI|nr:hypothetical protein C8A00DRAFT_43010 [Chaetomidium leptoderma]